ncbi:hypothetical protein [Yinghuangia soli]|uniref:Peptidase MA-like domain-containing protein n=1 Tax=Yinghuangia soli TaxID=2908204 RepID=A0AA41Q8V8_9ACTN|nr:hypothetical protein [Yinghuangia soli]MCF2533740.1 hypothetical protein [Yinghuangia soli]
MAEEPHLTGTAGGGATAADGSGGTVIGDGRAATGPRVPRALLALVAGVLACALAMAVLLGAVLDGGRGTAGAVVDAVGRTGAAADTGTDRKPEPAPSSTRLPDLARDEIAKLAAAQTDALARKDLAAFLAPYAADRPELIAERTRLFGNLLKIPFTVAEYRLQSATPDAAQSAGNRRTSSVTVVFSHQVTGVDTAPIGETYHWTVTRAEPGAPLQITKADGGSDTGRGNSTYPAPWDSDELVVVQKPHVLLLAARRHQAKAATWAARAETAATRNLAAWKSPEKTPQRFLVYLTPDRASFEKVRGGDSVTTNAIGVCLSLPADPSVRTADTPDFAGSRIYVDSTSDDITDGAADDAVAIFRHEMGHAMVAPFQRRSSAAGAAPPLWVAEGFAGYLEWSDRSLDRWYVPPARELVRSGKFDGKLPTDAQIYAADAKTSASGYYFAMLAIRYIADKYGAAKAYEFVLAVYRAPQPEAVDAALKAVTGLDRTAFESKWAQYVKSKAG